MFLRRIFKGMPDMGPWVSAAEMLAAVATVAGTLVALRVVPSPFGGPAMGTVSGIVTDVNTGKPVPEATVQVIDSSSQVIAAESVPDAQGNWKEKVKAGNYMMKAVCDGYRPASKTVTVAEGKIRVVRLSILPQPKETAQGGAPQAPTRTVETRIIMSGGGRSSGGAPRPASGSGGGGAASSGAAAPSGVERQVEALIAEAKKLNNADKANEAVDKLCEASNLDPTDGRVYALAVKIRANQGNWADAKVWYSDGMRDATKHKRQVEDAGELLKAE